MEGNDAVTSTLAVASSTVHIDLYLQEKVAKQTLREVLSIFISLL